MKRYKLKDLSISKLEYGSGAAACEYDGNTRYVRITDIDGNGKLGDDIVSPNNIDEKYILNDGDVLFARTGATVGKTYRYHEVDGRCLYAGFLIRVIPNQKIIRPDYLYYFTKSPQYNSFVQSSMKVVAQPNINAKQYGDLEFNVPELEIQDEIIEKLSKIVRIIDARKQELSKMDELIKARFVELFGECNSYEKLENADVIISDGNYSSKYPTADEFVGDGVPFIRASNMVNNTITDEEMYFISEEKHAELLKGHVKPYDVLIATRGAGIGKIAVVPERHNDSNINAQIVLLRCNFKEYNPLYLSWYLKLQTTQMKIQGLVSGSAQPQLPIKRLIQLELLKPEIEMQNQFADFVRQIDKSKVVVQKALDEAQLLFDSLMQKYFG